MVKSNSINTPLFDPEVLGIDFLLVLPEVFLALSVSSLLVFGACV